MRINKWVIFMNNVLIIPDQLKIMIIHDNSKYPLHLNRQYFMTSHSRNTADRQLSHSFSNYFDSKHPNNISRSRSNFTFHQFPSENTLFDDSLLKRFHAFSERVSKYSHNITHRLTLCSKDVEQLERGVEQRINEDTNSYNTLLNEMEEIITFVEDKCQSLNEEKVKTSDEECRWMSKQLSEIKNGFKDIQKQRNEEIKVKLRELNEEIEEVGVTLEKQKILRDEISESQIQEFGEEILKIQEMLSQQREERIHNNNLLMEEIEEMDEALERAISGERETREKKEALFTTLLEETYIKLHQ